MTKAATVLLLHKNDAQAVKVSESLQQDDCIVLGPFDTVAEAYVAILKNTPDFAIIDTDISQHKTETLSDTLMQLNVEHLLMVENSTQLLKRRLGFGAIKGILVEPFKDIITGIQSEIWSMQNTASNIRQSGAKASQVIG